MLKDLLKAGYPALYMLTQEPDRAEDAVMCLSGITYLAWNCITGIRAANSQKVVEDMTDPIDAITYLNSQQDTLMIFHNLDLFFSAPEVIQAVQNGAQIWKARGNTAVLVAPSINLPVQLEKVFTVIDLPLPDKDRLMVIMKEIAEGAQAANPEISIKCSRAASEAAKGLTEMEAETAFALSLAKHNAFVPEEITKAKAQMIRKSGLMEFWPPASEDEVGGLEHLRTYVKNRLRLFEEPDKFKQLRQCLMILLVGVPGTGKSLFSKAVASMIQWPLLRWDLASMKGSLVGQSEQNLKRAFALKEAFGPAVLWWDEVEKALGSARSSAETGDTTGSMLGLLLNWTQETKSPMLIMATANDVTKLPPEFIRRFDVKFFVDIPTLKEQKEILAIMNRKYGTNVEERWLPDMDGFTGSEIEQAVKDSLFDGEEDAIDAIVPIAKTMKQEIDALREWAKTRARRANAEEQEVKGRKVRLA